MTNLTSELLQEISVRCASKFMTKEASLSEAIAEEGKSLELNPEQLQRVIETTNTIAYLRQLQDTPDRTFEFPVADYNQVLYKMAMPIDISTPTEDTSTSNFSIEDTLPSLTSNFSGQEKLAMLSKEVLRCRELLTKMAYDKAELALTLVKEASIIKNQEYALEKVAHIVEEDHYDTILNLCNLEKKASESKLVFTDKELEDVNRVYSLYKQAKELIAEEKNITSFVKRASSVLEGLGYYTGRPLGEAINKGVLGPAKGVFNAAKRTGSILIQEHNPLKPLDPLKPKTKIIPSPLKLAGKMFVGGIGIEHANNVWGKLN